MCASVLCVYVHVCDMCVCERERGEGGMDKGLERGGFKERKRKRETYRIEG